MRQVALVAQRKGLPTTITPEEVRAGKKPEPSATANPRVASSSPQAKGFGDYDSRGSEHEAPQKFWLLRRAR